MRRIVDDDTAGRGRLGRVFLRNGAARRKQADLHLREIEVRQVLDIEFTIAKIDGLADRALAGQGVDLPDRELPLAEYLQHGLADDACGADDCDIKLVWHVSDFRD